jgi:hypothetical protein
MLAVASMEEGSPLVPELLWHPPSASPARTSARSGARAGSNGLTAMETSWLQHVLALLFATLFW